MKPTDDNRKNRFDNFIWYSSLGFEMMAIIGIFTFVGYKIDQWLKNEFRITTFVLMIFSVIIAILYGIKGLLKK